MTYKLFYWPPRRPFFTSLRICLYGAYVGIRFRDCFKVRLKNLLKTAKEHGVPTVGYRWPNAELWMNFETGILTMTSNGSTMTVRGSNESIEKSINAMLDLHGSPDFLSLRKDD